MIKDKAFQNKHSIYVLVVNSSDHNVQVALKVAFISGKIDAISVWMVVHSVYVR